MCTCEYNCFMSLKCEYRELIPLPNKGAIQVSAATTHSEGTVTAAFRTITDTNNLILGPETRLTLQIINLN